MGDKPVFSASGRYPDPGINVSAAKSVYDDGINKVNASVSASIAKSFQTYGSSIDYSNSYGHGFSLGGSTTPQNNHREATAKATVNLFQSKNTSVDAFARTSRDNFGHKSHGGGIGFTYRF